MVCSACLLGLRCRYNGTAATDERVVALAGRHVCIPICPEQMGGLPTPRDSVEWRDGRAVTASGWDLTEIFQRGVEEALRLVTLVGARVAILQPRSPSCGIAEIYDGTFSGRLVPGRGCLATALAEAGCTLVSPEDLSPVVRETR